MILVAALYWVLCFNFTLAQPSWADAQSYWTSARRWNVCMRLAIPPALSYAAAAVLAWIGGRIAAATRSLCGVTHECVTPDCLR